MIRPKEGDVFTVELGEGLGTVTGVLARRKGLAYAFLDARCGHQATRFSGA